MNLRFNIEESSLIQLKTRFDEKEGTSICSFVFSTSEWNNVEKYVIFWNKSNDNKILSLGSSYKTQCILPNFIKDKNFYIQIYANDKLKTNKIEVDLSLCYSSLIEEIEEEQLPIDDIVLKNNALLIYSKKQLVKTIKLRDEKAIKEIIKSILTNAELTEDGAYPVASKYIYEALLKKLDKTDISDVGKSGEYDDLLNIPTEFDPKSHTHNIEDINETQLNDFYITRINLLLNDLADEINKE